MNPHYSGSFLDDVKSVLRSVVILLPEEFISEGDFDALVEDGVKWLTLNNAIHSESFLSTE